MKRNVIAFLLMAFCLCAVILCTANASAAEYDLELLYDDRKELSDLVDATGQVTISNQQVTSYKVGTKNLDDNVLVYQDGVLYAVGTGTAQLKVGNKTYSVKVSPAPISLFMITGHSLGAGEKGTATQSVVVEAGRAYSSYNPKSLNIEELDGYGLGWGAEKRVGGQKRTTRWDSQGHLDAFAAGEGGTTGTGSGFAYRWNQVTGEKVWVINIAVGGSTLCEWLPGGLGHNSNYDPEYYKVTTQLYTYAQTILKNEVAAGHYIFMHQGILNFSGYNFSYYPGFNQSVLNAAYETLWNSYQVDLATVDIDNDGQKDGLDVIGFCQAWGNGGNSYDRPYTWYMGTSEAYPHMTVASAVARLWRADLSLFPQIDYDTQSEPVHMPESLQHKNNGGTSTNSIICSSDTTHFSQVAYNAMGLDMGENMAAYFKNNGGQAQVESFKLEDISSKPIAETVDIVVGESYIMTPTVEPANVSNLTYEVTGAAILDYPLAVKGISVGNAKLTVKQGNRVLAEVNFRVEAAHTHCYCGENLTGVAQANHECQGQQDYVPLNKYSFTAYRYTGSSGSETHTYNCLPSGNYYLDGDMTLTDSIYVFDGATVNICLNGYKLTSSARVFKSSGTVNICDCSKEGNGTIHSNNTGVAPISYGYSGGKLNIYGGKYTAKANKSDEYREGAGLIAVYNQQLDYDLDNDGKVDASSTRKPGEVNIYAGTFIGTDLSCNDGSPTCNGIGGCVMMFNANCTLRIYGGSFQGAQTVPEDDGGKVGGSAIGVTKGKLYLYGGTFSGPDNLKGMIYSEDKVYVGGQLTFAEAAGPDIYLNGGMINVMEQGLDTATQISVGSSKLNTVVVTLVNAAQASHFACEADYQLTQDGKTLSLVQGQVAPPQVDTTYCVCGGTISQAVKTLSGHVCEDAQWETWSFDGFDLGTKYIQQETKLYLYLECDVLVDYPIEIPDGCALHINLNGHKLGASNWLTSGLLRVYGDLTICDTSAEKTGLVEGIRTTGTETSTVLLLNYANPNGYSPKFDLYSGTLTGRNVNKTTGEQTYSEKACVMQIGNNKINQDAVFNMYGGVIRDGISMTAGNVYLSQGTMNMYDGLITGGRVVNGDGTGGKQGGNLRVNTNTSFNMYGGTISNGTNEVSQGGNIYIAGGTVKLEGGTIENGLAKTQGGNIYIANGQVEIDGVTIQGGGATSHGGNIAVVNGSLTIEDSQLLGGMAGDLYTRNATSGKLTATADSTASGNGGNLYVADAAEVAVYRTTLSNGSAHKANSNGFGGNVYNRNALYMEGCTITGGSGSYGGGVAVADSNSGANARASATTLVNCNFSNNSATNRGSSVGLYSSKNGATVEISGCIMDDSTQSSTCGVIGTNAAANATELVTITVRDCTITNNNPNISKNYGIWIDYGRLILEGKLSIQADDCDIYAQIGMLVLGRGLKAEDTITLSTEAITSLMLGENASASLELLTPGTLDLNGYTLTGDISGEEQFTLVDTATDDYTGTYGKLIGIVSAPMDRQNTVGDKNYLILVEEGGYSAHRYELALTHISLDAGNDALGYKAKLTADQAVLDAITEFGFDMGIVDGNTRNYAKAFDGDTVLTLRLKNIMSAGGGEMGICAQAYVKVGDQIIYTEQNQTSMKDAILAVNELTVLSDAQKATVYGLYAQYSETMDTWFQAAEKTNNILAWAPVSKDETV